MGQVYNTKKHRDEYSAGMKRQILANKGKKEYYDRKRKEQAEKYRSIGKPYGRANVLQKEVQERETDN